MGCVRFQSRGLLAPDARSTLHQPQHDFPRGVIPELFWHLAQCVPQIYEWVLWFSTRKITCGLEQRVFINTIPHPRFVRTNERWTKEPWKLVTLEESNSKEQCWNQRRILLLISLMMISAYSSPKIMISKFQTHTHTRKSTNGIVPYNRGVEFCKRRTQLHTPITRRVCMYSGSPVDLF